MTVAPRALALPSLLGVLAQLTQGVIGLSLLLVGHAAGLSVTVSSLAVTGFALGVAVGRPAQGRALDLVPPGRVLAGCGLVHGLAYAVVAVAAHERWPLLFVAAGTVAGLALPPIATQMRAEWPPRFTHPTQAFAAISMLQTVSVLIAPLLFTVVDGVASPTAAMLTVAWVAAGATVLFGLGAHGRIGSRPVDRVPLHRYLLPIAVSLLIGAASGAYEVAAPALALAAHHPSVAGLLVAASTCGTIAGGIGAMSRFGRAAPAETLLMAGASIQVVAAVALAAAAPLGLVAVALFVAGVGIAPALAAASLLVARRAAGTAEAFGWQSTGTGLGLALGSAAAGLLVHLGAHWTVAPALACALACTVLAGAASRRNAATS